jgi:hypothetical protein
MSGPLYSCAGFPLWVLAAGCWTVGSWPTGVRADQSPSAHGRGARSGLDDIEENTRVRRDLSHREGPGLRMTNLQTVQVLGASHRA